MLRLFSKTLKTGVVTERIKKPAADELEQLGIEVKQQIDRHFKGSLAIRAVDAGSCNGCELEIHALNNPIYDIERFGIHFAASPRHADVLLVTGPVSRHMQSALLRVWQATPEPKWVIAAGDCAVCGGEFGESYACCGSVDKVVPVDVTIPGCPPTPEMLLKGILGLINGAKTRSQPSDARQK